tara:strand:+ start:485 stop:718 length:234 start_codon:yes stop_codon:yes gene_type:complete
MDPRMNFFFTVKLWITILAIASSAINNPIIIVRAINTPIKVKPTEEWTMVTSKFIFSFERAKANGVPELSPTNSRAV